MLIIGAGGLASEILEIIHRQGLTKDLAFYDDVNHYSDYRLFDNFPIISNLEAAKFYLNTTSPNVILGVGTPSTRKFLADKFTSLGGILTSTIDDRAIIGSYGVEVGDGCNILAGAVVSNKVKIGNGCLIYYNSSITHDCHLGNFVEVSPGAQILGRVAIGNYASIGSNSTILPDVTVGSGAIVGAGAVVTKNVPENCVVVGIPARVIRKNQDFAT